MEMKVWWSCWCDHAIMKGSVTAIYKDESVISVEIVTVDGFQTDFKTYIQFFFSKLHISTEKLYRNIMKFAPALHFSYEEFK